MIDYSNCKLYGLQSKKILGKLLNMDKKYLKHTACNNQITPYIEDKNGKKRLIEVPSEELKDIQKKIKNLLSQIIVPDNIFSGIKRKSYVGNAKMHKDYDYVFKTDLTCFFPSIPRDRVYKFFMNDLKCSPDVAKILTNLTTINLDTVNCKDKNAIFHFLSTKGIDCTNHLLTGAPTSQILSYLSNIQMFTELQELSDKFNIEMSIYVDDFTFSSKSPITLEFRKRVNSIISKYGYKQSKGKTKLYKKEQFKQITGVIITPTHETKVRNSLHHKTIEKFKQFKSNPSCKKTKQQLRGLVTACRQIEPNIFPSINNLAFSDENIIE